MTSIIILDSSDDEIEISDQQCETIVRSTVRETHPNSQSINNKINQKNNQQTNLKPIITSENIRKDTKKFAACSSNSSQPKSTSEMLLYRNLLDKRDSCAIPKPAPSAISTINKETEYMVEAECNSNKPLKSSSPPKEEIRKRKLPGLPNNDNSFKKRLKPTQVSDKVDRSWVASQSPLITIDEDDTKEINSPDTNRSSTSNEEQSQNQDS